MRNVNETDRTFYKLDVVDQFSWHMVDLVCTLGVCIAPAAWQADLSVTLILASNGESPLLWAPMVATADVNLPSCCVCTF